MRFHYLRCLWVQCVNKWRYEQTRLDSVLNVHLSRIRKRIIRSANNYRASGFRWRRWSVSWLFLFSGVQTFTVTAHIVAESGIAAGHPALFFHAFIHQPDAVTLGEHGFHVFTASEVFTRAEPGLPGVTSGLFMVVFLLFPAQRGPFPGHLSILAVEYAPKSRCCGW